MHREFSKYCPSNCIDLRPCCDNCYEPPCYRPKPIANNCQSTINPFFLIASGVIIGKIISRN